MILHNSGTTTVTYEWKKIERGDFIASKNSDGIQRFYCHYTRDTLKPGESKPFIFSFRSEKPGMFNEEWELLTEPQLLEAAPILNLSGMATKADEFVDKRRQINVQFETELAQQTSADQVEEIVGDVKTPPQAPESVRLTLAQRFEKRNAYLGLKYTDGVYQKMKDHYQFVVERLEMQPVQPNDPAIEPFDVEVEYIEELITRINNPYVMQRLQAKYVELLYEAKKLPIDRA